jgi:hypothetical protein
MSGRWPEQHKRVNRKMDLYILPVLSLLYLMNGIDRGNVGNAAVSMPACRAMWTAPQADDAFL